MSSPRRAPQACRRRTGATSAAARRRRVAQPASPSSSSAPSAFLVFQGLGNATVYFKTADEAVAEKDDLGDRRFRIEGDGRGRHASSSRATTCALRRSRSTATRSTSCTRATRPSCSSPASPSCSKVAGRATYFASDRIMVKHTEEYRDENPDRVEDYAGRPGQPGRRLMNALVGQSAVLLGLARRGDRRGDARRRAGARQARPVLRSGPPLRVAAARRRGHRRAGVMERALLTHDFSLAVRRRQPQPVDAAALHDRRRCGRPSRARSCCGGWCWPATSRRWRGSSATGQTDPLVGWATLAGFVVAAFFFGLMARARQPVPGRGRRACPPTGPGPTRCCRTTR